jgi:uncharacterized protein (DUF1330 family)
MNTAQNHIDPTDDQITALLAGAETSTGPVTMINLLSFNDAPDGGKASYLRYAEAVQPHLDRVGAQVVYAGDAGERIIGAPDGTWWDAVVVVQYPSRAKFVEMALDPTYQDVAAHRTTALRTSALVATDPWQW